MKICTRNFNYTTAQTLHTSYQTCFRLNKILVGEEYQSPTDVATDVYVFDNKLPTKAARTTVTFCPNVNLISQRQERTLHFNTTT